MKWTPLISPVCTLTSTVVMLGETHHFHENNVIVEFN